MLKISRVWSAIPGPSVPVYISEYSSNIFSFFSVLLLGWFCFAFPIIAHLSSLCTLLPYIRKHYMTLVNWNYLCSHTTFCYKQFVVSILVFFFPYNPNSYANERNKATAVLTKLCHLIIKHLNHSKHKNNSSWQSPAKQIDFKV